MPDGIHVRIAPWVTKTEIADSGDDKAWQNPRTGLYYNPARPREAAGLLELVERFAKPMPVKLLQSKGFLASVMEDERGYSLQLVAADYDVDINHELDEMRDHRSRVNLITMIAPAGTDGEILVRTEAAPTVYTPFCEGRAQVAMEGGTCRVTLPDGCAYALLRFGK